MKRRRTEDSPLSSDPTTPATEPKAFAKRSDIRAAKKVESALEELASRRAAANNAIETHWVLDVHIPAQKGLHVAEVAEDGEASEDEDDWNVGDGRQTYGSYKQKKQTSGGTSSRTSTPKYKADNADIGLKVEFDDDFEDLSGGEMSEEEDRNTQHRKHKTSTMDYTDEDALAALDKVDLAKSKYAKSKGAFLPMRHFGNKGEQGRHTSGMSGKFKNKDRIQKNTKARKR